MIRQDVILNMTPGPNKPGVNVSQFDTGARVLVFHLRQGGESFTPPNGCVAIIHGIKPDETYFSYTAEIDGDTVIADCTEQMTAVPGFAECEIKITNTEGRVGSCNFRLLVEKSPETGAIISDTDIPAFEQLATRAEQAAATAISAEQGATESAEAAAESATNAGESADRAAREAETASQAAEEAGESAVSATESASSASGSEASARQYSAAAEGFANDASESAQGAAQDAQTASVKASEASASADRASGWAVDSATAANLASGYADTARTQAQAAGESATNAAGSASTATTAAGTATTKAGEASDSAIAANTSAGQAASSANAASTSAGNASASATAASESATAASGSASTAAGSASDASDSADSAAASASAAAQSAADIAASAAQIQINTDNIAALQIVESTSAADITSIDDGADSVPMKSLKVYIEPVQEGSGDPSPDNIRPISGWDSVETVRTDANGGNRLTITTDLPTTVYGGVLDVISGELTVDRAMVAFDGSESGWSWFASYQQASIALPAPSVYATDIVLWLCNRLKPVSNLYRSPNVGNYASMIANGASAAFSTPETTLDGFKAWATANPIQFAYKLATPTTYTLTPEEVKTLLKANNIFADAGQTAIVYVADPKTYIDNSIADAVASLT